ncbi:MAG: polynucleotide adenylyltransferase PcnB [Planctomycetota bacterium]
MSDTGPLVIAREQHNVSRKQIDPDALRVLYGLKDRGFKAYLVGGSVRDLLFGVIPKDFDVATDAQPRQVKRLFRNCWIIGRRFRLAQVKFGEGGKKIIEVSTFRAAAPETPAESEVQILADDNIFGTPGEDARRRDFTMNALFYSVEDFSVIDFVGGVQDIRDRVVRSIGDPMVRYREDPVRMLRAVKFLEKLSCKLADDDEAAMGRLADLLAVVPESRLTDELHKIFKTGASGKILRAWHNRRLLAPFAPGLSGLMERDASVAVLGLADRLEAEGRPLDRTLLWSLLLASGADEALSHGNRPDQAADAYVTRIFDKLRVGRHDKDTIRHILLLVQKMKRPPRPQERTLRHPLAGHASRVLE